MKRQSKNYFNFSLNLLFPSSTWKHAVHSTLASCWTFSLRPKAFRLSVNVDLARNRRFNSLRQLPVLPLLLLGSDQALFSFCYQFWGLPSVFFTAAGCPHRIPGASARASIPCSKREVSDFLCQTNKKVNFSAVIRNKSVAGHAAFWIEPPKLSHYRLYNFWPFSDHSHPNSPTGTGKSIFPTHFYWKHHTQNKEVEKRPSEILSLPSFPRWKTEAAQVCFCICRETCILEIPIFVFFGSLATSSQGDH